MIGGSNQFNIIEKMYHEIPDSGLFNNIESDDNLNKA